MPMRIRILMFALVALAAGPAFAADPERGRLLYENHCMVCHESVVHVRKKRKVEDPEALRAQIRRWSQTQRLGWGEDEIADVQAFLGQRYYDFAP